MAVAALVVSIVSALAALGALIGLRYSRQSANAAQGSQAAADSAAVSAVTAAAAAQAQAEAARRQMENDRARLHREMTPELEGSVRGRQFGRGVVSYQLEVRAKMSQPLSSLRLTLPAGGPIAQRRGAMEMRHDLFYPDGRAHGHRRKLLRCQRRLP
jgi:hypothetical protein